MTPGEWLGRYVYLGIHEIFFIEFPIIMYEWLARLEFQKKKIQGGEPRGWTPQLIRRLESVNNPISRAVDFWVESILEGYITEMAVDSINSYSEVEREFFRGPQGRYLKSLKLWIKILVCE